MTASASWFLKIGGAITGVFLLLVVAGPALAPYDPQAVVGASLVAPSGAHLLGTNDAGQDILSQLLVGTRASMLTGILAATLAVAAGVLVGATAGLLGGWADLVAMRIVDVFLAIPALPLVILIASLAGPSRATIVAVIALAGWPPISRIVRSQTLVLASRGYVHAAKGFDSGWPYVVRRHLVPGLAPLIVATYVNWASAAIVLEAGLAFIGLGDPTAVSWGSVLQRALGHAGIYATAAWTWWVLPAGLAVAGAAIGLAFLGVAIEPRSNPRWARS